MGRSHLGLRDLPILGTNNHQLRSFPRPCLTLGALKVVFASLSCRVCRICFSPPISIDDSRVENMVLSIRHFLDRTSLVIPCVEKGIRG